MVEIEPFGKETGGGEEDWEEGTLNKEEWEEGRKD